MQVKIFTFPILEPSVDLDEMNAFLRANKVVTIDRQLVVQNDTAYWSCCVVFIPSNANQQQIDHKTKVDYRQVLGDAEFSVFSALRAIRKVLAEKDAVPAYSVFTDAELAEMAKLDVGNQLTEKALRGISGIGERRIEKYGANMLNMYFKQKEQ